MTTGSMGLNMELWNIWSQYWESFQAMRVPILNLINILKMTDDANSHMLYLLHVICEKFQRFLQDQHQLPQNVNSLNVFVYLRSYNRELKFWISSKSANTSSLKSAPYFSSGTSRPENGVMLYVDHFQEGAGGSKLFDKGSQILPKKFC